MNKLFRAAVLIIVTGLIFHNSMVPADLSKETSHLISGPAAELLRSFFAGADPETVDHIVRKCAHFSEYFVLSLVALWTFASFGLKGGKLAFAALGYVFLAAAADEYIQTFTPGRSGQVSDVLLDFCGGAAAVAVKSVATRLRRG